MKSMYRRLLLTAVVALPLALPAGAFAKDQAPQKLNKSKVSYVVGWEMASQIPQAVREEIDPKQVAEAVEANLSGKKMKMSKEDAQSVSTALMTQLKAKAQAKRKALAAKNKKEGKAFLAKNKKASGVKTTKSGLQYKVLKKGKGEKPGKHDIVQVEYVGTYLDGKKFDASAAHPSPKDGKSMPIPLDHVIPGFREGLELMKEGSHYKFWIPADLAYGANPRNAVPPNATLVFDVQLEKTKHPEKKDAGNTDAGNGG